MELTEILNEITNELLRAEKKFPEWPKDEVHGAAILGEEAGELLKAAIDYYYGRSPNKEIMKKEAVQTGAMAVRFLINL